MTIGIVGSTSPAGVALKTQAKISGQPVISFASNRLSHEDLNASSEFFVALSSCDAIINVASINPSSQRFSPATAYLLNIQLPRILGELTSLTSQPLIHLSTDSVYGSNELRLKGALESEPPSPADLYGYSRLFGEQACPSALILRGSVLGPSLDGSGLFNWISGLKPNSEIKGLTNHMWNGVSTTTFARFLISNCIPKYQPNTVWNVFSEGSISKFDLIHQLRPDLLVTKTESPLPSFRVLSSSFPETGWSTYALENGVSTATEVEIVMSQMAPSVNPYSVEIEPNFMEPHS